VISPRIDPRQRAVPPHIPETKMPPLLDFHRRMVSELLDAVPDGHTEDDPDIYDAALARATNSAQLNPDAASGDGLLIAGKGLGLQRVLLSLVRLYMDPRFLVLLINTPEREADSLRDATLQREVLLSDVHRGEEEQDGLPTSVRELRIINNETLSSARRELYSKGGVLAVTSRILITDMLNDHIPIDMVSGILVNHAHRVHETSTEAFILRIFRQKNKKGFVKAFSENPEDFVHGMWRLEKSMKALYLRRVFLHPRFQVHIMDELQRRGEPNVFSVKVPMTDAVKQIQAAIIECVDACIRELARSNTWVS
jgi:DNA excision repair protein ERCC-4